MATDLESVFLNGTVGAGKTTTGEAVAGNYRDIGVRRFILAGVLEQSTEVERYRAALGGGKLTVIRLAKPNPGCPGGSGSGWVVGAAKPGGPMEPADNA